jgi:hypothetical protein
MVTTTAQDNTTTVRVVVLYLYENREVLGIPTLNRIVVNTGFTQQHGKPTSMPQHIPMPQQAWKYLPL